MLTSRQVSLLESEMLRHRAMASIDEATGAVHKELADALGAALAIMRRDLLSKNAVRGPTDTECRPPPTYSTEFCI